MSATTIRAALLTEVGADLVVDEVELDPPRAGEVAVDVHHCGVCHSDVHYLDGSLRTGLPVVLGHEAAGVVAEVGQARTKALAAATLPGVSLGGLQGRASGRISRIGKVRAWTEGRGRIVRRDIEGTIPGVLTCQGQSYTLPLGGPPDLPPELADLVSIQTGVTDQSDARGLRVTALRITLLGGTDAGTVVDLGNATASIRES